MMKTHILTPLFLLAGLAGMAQTNQPLPPDAQPLTALTYLSPSDSTVWLYNERSSLAINVGVWADVVELFNQKWSNAQIDSAIAAQIGGINFPVTSVNSMTGDVTLAPTDLGLGNVDNTSDANKPISTATQDALDGKENTFSKGNLVAGTGVTLSGTLANRLVGSGNVTINAANSLTASNGLQISSGNITPVYGTAANTVAQGNDSRINNGQTAFGWGDYRQFGLGVSGVGVIDNDLLSEASGLYSVQSSNTASAFPGMSGGVINIRSAVAGGGRAQINILGNNAVMPRMAIRHFNPSGVPTNWYEVYHSGNLTPPSVFTVSTNGLVPSPGTTTGDRKYLDHYGNWTVPAGGGGGGTATDLNIQNRTSTTLQISSSTGTAATVPSATTSLSGLMSAADKAKLNEALTEESDPSVPNHVKSITTGNVNNWNTAYNRGDFRDYGLGTSSITATSLEDFNDIARPSSFIRAASISNTPFSGTGVAAHLNYGVDRSYQLWMASVAGGSLQFRHGLDGSWGAVRTVWHDGNFTPSDYLTTANFTWPNLSGKPSTFTPSAHTHSANDINSGTLATARIPSLPASKITSGTFPIARIPTGTSSSTVAVGNDSRINNGQTAFEAMGNYWDIYNAPRYEVLSNLNSAERGQFELNSTASNRPGGGYASVVTVNQFSSGNNDLLQINWPFRGSGNFAIRNKDNSGNWSPWVTYWNDSNLPNPASSGTGSTQVRNNSQLDARYLQSVSGGSGVNVSGSTISVDNTVIRTTGNQTVGGTKTFGSPVLVPNATSGNHAVNLNQLNSVTNNGRLLRNYDVYGEAQTISGAADAPGAGYTIYRIGPRNLDLSTGDFYGDATLVVTPQTFVNHRDKVNRTGWITLTAPYAISFIVDRTGGVSIFDSGDLFTESTNVTKVIKYDISVSLRSNNSLYMSVMLDYGGQIKVFDQVLSGTYQPTSTYNFTIMASFRGSGGTRNLAATSLSQTIFLPSYASD